jgi:hypothetical protein
MPYFVLKQKLTEIREPTQEFWDCFEEKLFERNPSDKDIWLNQGNTGKKIALLIEGGAVSYIRKEGKKLVNKLWIPNNFILSPSVFTHTASEHTIEFRGDSHIIQFSIDAINQLRKTFDEALYYIDYFLGLEMRAADEHLLWQKSFTSQKHHTDAIQKYGKVYLNLNNHEKGSFLGVTEKWIRDIL